MGIALTANQDLSLICICVPPAISKVLERFLEKQIVPFINIICEICYALVEILSFISFSEIMCKTFDSNGMADVMSVDLLFNIFLVSDMSSLLHHFASFSPLSSLQ